MNTEFSFFEMQNEKPWLGYELDHFYLDFGFDYVFSP